MAVPDFEKSTKLATELLHRQNIKNRILSVRHLNYDDKHIKFESIQNYSRMVKRPLSEFLSKDNDVLKDGCTLILGNNTYLVLYNDQIKNWEHLNWTLAHEIGHIYLGHTKDEKLEEIEAHFFAAQLFMPEYSIFMMSKEHGNINTRDLVEIFGVSPEAADRRLRTMNRKNSFRASSIDKEIWEIQKERVDIYYSCGKDRYAYRNILDYTIYMEDEFENQMRMEMYASAY